MFWSILGILVVLAIAAVFGAAIAMFRIAMVRPKNHKPFDGDGSPVWEETLQQINAGREWFMEQNPRRVYVFSRDGLRLEGWFLPHPEAERTVICVHGYHSEGLRDYGAAVPYYYSTKSNLLVIDQRSHGGSEGKYIGFGVLERWDLVEWIHWVNGEFGDEFPIVLSGISMGSATVMMTLGLSLPDNVCAAVADCGYSSLWNQFAYTLDKRYHLPAKLILPCAEMISRMVTGVDFRSVSPEKELERCKIPVLFIHGAKDGVVPMTETTDHTYPACRTAKKLIIVDEATHGMSYSLERERCQKGLEWALTRKMKASEWDNLYTADERVKL